MSEFEARLEKLGHVLPTPPEPVGFYTPVLRFGSSVITSGQLPIIGSELMFKGKIGRELHEDDGQNAARICVLNALAQIKHVAEGLEHIKQIVRVEGYVNSAPGFNNQPHVLNGASELLVQVFGEQGKHTRIALGVSEMPMDAAVQLAVWVELKK